MRSIYVGLKAWIRTIHGWNCAKRGSMLRATIHGLSAHSVDRADRRAQSVDSGNPWTERSVDSPNSRKAGRCCARERVVLCARVRIGQETGSMRCTCINSLHNVFSHSAV